MAPSPGWPQPDVAASCTSGRIRVMKAAVCAAYGPPEVLQVRDVLRPSPDLVVEVLSPGDRPGETLAKIADWLSGGTRLVWVIDPERRLARIYRQDGLESILGEADALEGEDIFAAPYRPPDAYLTG